MLWREKEKYTFEINPKLQQNSFLNKNSFTWPESIVTVLLTLPTPHKETFEALLDKLIIGKQPYFPPPPPPWSRRADNFKLTNLKKTIWIQTPFSKINPISALIGKSDEIKFHWGVG